MTVAYVSDLSDYKFAKNALNESKEAAFAALKHACGSIKSTLVTVSFNQLAQSKTEILDTVYNADVLVVDMSVKEEQAILLYHLGLRESLKLSTNVAMVCTTEKKLINNLSSLIGQNTTVFPYMVNDDGLAVVVTANNTTGDLENLKSQLLKLPALSVELKHFFMEARKKTRVHMQEKFLLDLRRDREELKGNELRERVTKMRRRLDDPGLLSADIMLNMFLSYLKAEDYGEMVRLVEDIEALHTHQSMISLPAIQYYYAFALNRRNGKGDREKALKVINEVLRTCEIPSPDMYGLVGRIHKDRFIESGCTDKEALKLAIDGYRRGFERHNNEYLGVNLATLLVIDGADMSSGQELQFVCNILNLHIGRKGNLAALKDYWDVATFFEVRVLAEDYVAATRAAECMYRLDPPSWSLATTLYNIRLIFRFRSNSDAREQAPGKQLFNFWMEFFEETVKDTTEETVQPTGSKTDQKSTVEDNTKTNDAGADAPSGACDQSNLDNAKEPKRIVFPVIVSASDSTVIEAAYLQVNYLADKPNLSLCFLKKASKTGRLSADPNYRSTLLVSDMETDSEETTTLPFNEVMPKSSVFVFYKEDITGISLSRKNNRSLYFFTVNLSVDYSLVFASEKARSEFHEAVLNSIFEDDENYLVDYSKEEEPIKFEYERDDNNQLIVLGRGSFGVVYAGRELSREIKIAIKEIHCVKSKDYQPLMDEISLQSRLNHRNIVRYLGCAYENGVLKILMENVPGGSLSFLLKKTGALKEETVAHYSSQILEGIKYLHANRIIHRDIKGDNVLVNMFRGELKIADFGASKCFFGMVTRAETFTGTMRYMAPELINGALRGYGYPVDIWSFGCTVIEMLTGQLPYRELADPYAAVFRAGHDYAHPEIPEHLSDACKKFTLRCFTREPELRATATQLLCDPFLELFFKRFGKLQTQFLKQKAPRYLSQEPKERLPAPQAPASATLPGLAINGGCSSPPVDFDPALRPVRVPGGRTGSAVRRSGELLPRLDVPGRLSANDLNEPARAASFSSRFDNGSPSTPDPRGLDSPGAESCYSPDRGGGGGGSKSSVSGTQDNDGVYSPRAGVFFGSSRNPSPLSSSIGGGADNFNMIKLTAEARHQLINALNHEKETILNSWVRRVQEVVHLPIVTPSTPQPEPQSPFRSNSHDPLRRSESQSSQDRDEHDVIECLFEMLIDYLDNGGMLQSLSKIIKTCTRNVQIQQSRSRKSSGSAKLRPSLSFDVGSSSDENRFIAVVTRILRAPPNTPLQNAEGLVDFIFTAWLHLQEVLTEPLKHCFTHPHQVLAWAKLIKDAFTVVKSQLMQNDQSKMGLKRQQTLVSGAAGYRPGHDDGGGIFFTDSSELAESSGFRRTRLYRSERIRRNPTGARIDLSPSPVRHGVGASVNSTAVSSVVGGSEDCESPLPLDVNRGDTSTTPLRLGLKRLSSTSNPVSDAADSDARASPTAGEDGGQSVCGEDEEGDVTLTDGPSTSAGVTFEIPAHQSSKVGLRRNAHPPRYVKRPTPPVGISDLAKCQERCNNLLLQLLQVSDEYYRLLSSNLQSKQALINYLRSEADVNASILTPSPFDPSIDGYPRISTGHSSLAKWLSELGLPLSEIEKVSEHEFDQSDFLESITKEDLWRIGLTGGSVLRIWNGVCRLRRQFLGTSPRFPLT
nr:unnamed protein product [Spirometra erinaceieuropaei]